MTTRDVEDKLEPKEIAVTKHIKTPLFMIEGAEGTKKEEMATLLKSKYADLQTGFFMDEQMKGAKENMLSFLEMEECQKASAVAMVNGLGWNSINAKGATADKESAMRKVMSIAEKDYAPVLVIIASSRRDAEKKSNCRISGYVEMSEKFVQLYKSAGKKDVGLPAHKVFINTTYEDDTMALKKMVKKASKAVKDAIKNE